MTVALVGLAAVAVVMAIVLCHSHVAALVGVVRADREEIARERARHMDAVTELVANQAEERREWAQERHILLTRIQDPPAGVAASMAYLPAPPESGPLDVDFER